MKKNGFKLTMLVMMITCLFVQPVFAKEQTKLTIIHTNDTHANVEDNGKSIIGFAKMATYVEQMKAEGNVVVLDAGDMFQGMPFANMEKGHSIVPIVNEVGYDAMVPGNHEFDFGADNLLAIAEKINFPIVSANVLKDGKTVFEPYIVKEYAGLKVGVFGLTTTETPVKTHPNNVAGYEFAEITKSAAETVKVLKETEKVDVVIMVSHLGLDEGDATSDLVAEAVEGIDVIVDGHSHTELPEGRQVKDTLIVSTGTALKNIGKVELVIEGGKVVEKTASHVTYEALKEVEPKAVINEEIAKVKEAQKPILEKVVGTTEVLLNGERENVRTGETNLGQLATEAMIDLTGAQVAITNGGGIRKSIQPGNITMNDMVAVFPFGNTIMVKEMKGSDIVAALEHGVSEYPNQKGAFPHTAGMTFTMDANQEVGTRISDVKIQGEAIDLEAIYTVATNDFMAVGGDGYEMFKAYPIKREYNTLMDTLLAYVEKVGTVKGEFETRMTVIKAPVQVGLRAYVEEQAFEVGYDHGKKQVTLTKEDVVIILTIGEKAYQAKDKDSDVKAELANPVELKEDGMTYLYDMEFDAILEALAA